MAFTRALYYPSIDIHNERWLKTAILYWDEINTIVPSSIRNPYNTHTTKFLEDEGILKPLYVGSDMELIRNLADDALNYLRTNEAYRVLTEHKIFCEEHSQNMGREWHRLNRIHPGKMSYELGRELVKYLNEDGWMHVGEGFANFYMTLLANRICEKEGIAPLTDNVFSANFNNLARLDNQVISSYFDTPWDNRHTYFEGNQLAQGMLMNLSFQGISISDEVSIDDILKFKRQHQDELGLFRTNVENLTKSIHVDASYEQMRQQVKDIYVNQFLPGYNDLKESLKESRIRWYAKSLASVFCFSLGATAIPTSMLNLSIPTALLAGAVATVTASVVLYNTEKKSVLRHNPYSYLLAINNGI